MARAVLSPSRWEVMQPCTHPSTPSPVNPHCTHEAPANASELPACRPGQLAAQGRVRRLHKQSAGWTGIRRKPEHACTHAAAQAGTGQSSGRGRRAAVKNSSCGPACGQACLTPCALRKGHLQTLRAACIDCWASWQLKGACRCSTSIVLCTQTSEACLRQPSLDAAVAVTSAAWCRTCECGTLTCLPAT